MKSKKQEAQQKTRLKPEEYDLLVLGSGTGGKLIAWTLAKAGIENLTGKNSTQGGDR